MKLTEIKKIMENRDLPRDPEARQTYLQGVWQEMIQSENFYQELEMESRLVDTHRDESAPGSIVSLHSHSFCEVIYCCNTCGVEYLVGAERYRLRRGDVLLVAPGISHRPLFPENMEEPYRRYVLWLSTEFLDTMKVWFPIDRARMLKGTLLRTAGTKWDFLEEIFRRGVAESENAEPGWEAIVLGNTILLLTWLWRAAVDQSTVPFPAEKPELLERVMSYMEQNLSRKVTLGDAARQFYVSESTISQLFRKKMGVSFHQCLTQRRLIAAKNLIESGAVLEDVGRQVGFADYSSFYRAFRQEYGICPRQYRKRIFIPAEEND